MCRVEFTTIYIIANIRLSYLCSVPFYRISIDRFNHNAATLNDQHGPYREMPRAGPSSTFGRDTVFLYVNPSAS